MPLTIKKVHLINYRRFNDYTIEPNPQINVLAGDNEVGKSSILEAIDLVASGNIRRVEAIGIDKLLNIGAVQRFNAGYRTFDNLPKIVVELYLDLHDALDFTLNGKNNTSGTACDGIRLVCEANFDYRNEIIDSMKEQSDYFPYDYYSIRFSTFADEGYSGYKKKLRTTLIDSSNMNSDYATTDFVKRMYHQYTDGANITERAVHRSQYRKLKGSFRSDSLAALNKRIAADKKYAFGLKMAAATEFENDLMIFEDEISIDSKGTGRQVFIKTDFALERAGDNVDVILLEEPENHLSHTNLRKLVQLVSESKNGQLFVTTHNSLISTRLELQNLLLMGDNTSGSLSFYMTSNRYLFSNRLAFLLEQTSITDIQTRMVTYFDEFIIDEVQDIAGRDFSFLEKLMQTNMDMLYVGDFYQHTFDTSRDGKVNSTLFDSITAYQSRFEAQGFIIDTDLLKGSWRCSKSVCDYIRTFLGIDIFSARSDQDDTLIQHLTDKEQITTILRDEAIIKLHYREAAQFGPNHKNWGQTKGENHYQDVCVLLNKTTAKWGLD